MKREEALNIARKAWEVLKPHCAQLEVAGSIRRKRPDVKDAEFVMVPKVHQVEHPPSDLFGAQSTFTTERVPGFATAVESLGGILKGKPATGKYVQVLTPEGLALDLFIVYPHSWGYQLAIRTGSADFSKALAARWVGLGYNGKDGELTKAGKVVSLPTEEEFFALLRMRFPDPADRELTEKGLKPWITW